MLCYFVEIVEGHETTYHKFWQFTDETAEKLCKENKRGAVIHLYRFIDSNGVGDKLFLKDI